MINQLTDPRAEKITPTPSAAPLNTPASQISGGAPQLKKPGGMIPGAPPPITPMAATPKDALPTAVVRPSAAQNAGMGVNGGDAPQITPPPGMIHGLPAKIAPAPPAAGVTNPMLGGGNPVGMALANGTGASTPTLMCPGTALPDVNPQALGTQLGGALRDARRSTVNDQVDVLNTATRAGAGIANAATYLPRTILGGLRDTARGAAGLAPSPNAGQPIGGLTAPATLEKPYIQAPVNFVAGGQSTGPASNTVQSPTTAGVGVGTATTPQNPNYSPAADNISAANLAAVNKIVMPGSSSREVIGSTTTPPIQQPGINSGATVEGGRKLEYGAMVDGVPTFSDGSSGLPGVAGKIPRTMDEKTIKDLGAQLQTITHPSGVLARDTLGHAATSSEMVAKNLARAQATAPNNGSGPSAEQFAAADRNAVALRDPRSAAGIAAHNLAMEAQYGGTGTARRNASNGLADLTSGNNQAGLSSQQAAQKLVLQQQAARDAVAQTEQQGKNAIAEAEAQAEAETNALVHRPRQGQQVTLQDGTLGVQDLVNGSVTTSRLADGSPAKAQMTREDTQTKRSNEIMDQISKNAAELAKSAIASPPPDAPPNWKPNPSDFREQAAGFAGLEVRSDKSGKKYVNINGQVVPL